MMKTDKLGGKKYFSFIFFCVFKHFDRENNTMKIVFGV